MPPAKEIPPPELPRPSSELADLLIALNAEPGLTRDQLCRLATRPDLLAAGQAVDDGDLPVSRQCFELALRSACRARSRARTERARAESSGIRILLRYDPDYPPELLDLELPPPVLYCRGALPDAPAIAIVGPRATDAYGLEVARWFAHDLAAAGLLVASGFARGVDGAAHRAALEAAGGQTVAVLGCGLDVDYPRGQRRLKDQIAERGCVLSEFPLGTGPRPFHFPVRNRIIAALAWATVVVQARRRSGSLVTARLALELGREVLAVPGRIFDPRSEGSNLLLRDGARPALDPQEILETLPLCVRDRLRQSRTRWGSGSSPSEVPLEAAVLRALAAGPRGAESVAGELHLAIGEILAALGSLELDGRVRRYPGGAFGATRPPPRPSSKS